jgi:DNA-binding response OmpR family regulator
MIQYLRSSSELQHVTIIVSSASVFEDDKQKSLDTGADDFIAKPIEVAELLEKLRKYLELEWIYEEKTMDAIASTNSTQISKQKDNFSSLSNALEIIIPPINELIELHEWVLKGRIKGVQGQLAKIEAMDKKYGAFVQHIKYL